MSLDKYIYIGEPNDVVLEGLRTRATGEIDSAATITARIKTVSGVPLGVADTTMNPIGSEGNYRGTIEAIDEYDVTLNPSGLVEATDYYVWITSSGKTLRRLKRTAKYREET